MKRLPPVTPNREKFAKEFLGFCKVYMPTIPQVKYLMVRHLGPVQYLKIKAKNKGDSGPMNPEWEHEANVIYRVAITDLCNAIRKAFPKKVGYLLIRSTTQWEGETPVEFLSRLQAVYDEHSGIPKPDAYPGPELSAYEGYLVHHFLDGLLPQVRDGVKATCIPPHLAGIKTITCHAMHAYNCQQESMRKKAIQREEELRRAIVTWNRWGQGGQGGWGKRRRWRDRCFVCGADCVLFCFL